MGARASLGRLGFDASNDSTDSRSKKPLGPMQVQFTTDFAYEATLGSALSVEFCSRVAETEVYSDVLVPITQMLSPRIATTAELEAEGIDWKNPIKAIVQIAHLEMRDGKLLAQGYYLRAAIAYFGEDFWWKLCTTPLFQYQSLLGVVFCIVESKVRPNETVFGLTIPPKGHPLRKDSIVYTNIFVTMHFPDALIAHFSVRHSVNAQLALLRTLEEFIGSDKEWNKMLLRPCSGLIAATMYLWRSKGKAKKRIFRALLPAEISLTDAAFWYKHSPDVLGMFKRHNVSVTVVNDFKKWVGANAMAALRIAETEYFLH